jgi:hypothetical protein
MAAVMAQARGWRIDEDVRKSVATESARVVGSLNGAVQAMLQGREGGGQPDTQLYDVMMMIASGEPASRGTDAFVHYLAAKQRPEGYWQGIGASRAPIQDGNLSRTGDGDPHTGGLWHARTQSGMDRAHRTRCGLAREADSSEY